MTFYERLTWRSISYHCKNQWQVTTQEPYSDGLTSCWIRTWLMISLQMSNTKVLGSKVTRSSSIGCYAILSIRWSSHPFASGASPPFDASQHVVVLGLSLFVLGLAIRPLLWGPLSGRYSFAAVNFCTDVRSELYGRKHVSSFTYAVVNIGKTFSANPKWYLANPKRSDETKGSRRDRRSLSY